MGATPSEASDDAYLIRPLLALTVVAGLTDAVSFLGLGRIFTANMTGNVVLLAFALGGARGLSATRSATALLVFVLGGFLGGGVANRRPRGRADLLMLAMKVECAFLSLAAGVSAFAPAALPSASAYAVIGCLAFAIGFRNAIVQKLAVPGVTTTVLTSTLTSLAAESAMAGGDGVRSRRRVLSILAMFGGALAGALLLRGFGIRVPLALAAVLVAVSALMSTRRRWRIPSDARPTSLAAKATGNAGSSASCRLSRAFARMRSFAIGSSWRRRRRFVANP